MWLLDAGGVRGGGNTDLHDVQPRPPNSRRGLSPARPYSLALEPCRQAHCSNSAASTAERSCLARTQTGGIPVGARGQPAFGAGVAEPLSAAQGGILQVLFDAIYAARWASSAWETAHRGALDSPPCGCCPCWDHRARQPVRSPSSCTDLGLSTLPVRPLLLAFGLIAAPGCGTGAARRCGHAPPGAACAPQTGSAGSAMEERAASDAVRVPLDRIAVGPLGSSLLNSPLLRSFFFPLGSSPACPPS